MKSISAGLWSFLGVLAVFPIAHWIVYNVNKPGLAAFAYLALILLGLALLFWSVRVGQSGQAILGGFAGLAFWSAFGEIGVAGDLFENTAIWGVVFMVTLLLVLRPGTRCDLFAKLQQLIRAPGSADTAPSFAWRAPIIAFEFFFITWVTHMLLLTAYYVPGLGPQSWLTYLLFGASLVATPFLLYLMYRTKQLDLAIGRAIPAVIIAWMWIEILMNQYCQ